MKDSRTAELVQRAKEGDEEALEHLYQMNCKKIYSLCLRMTSNQAEAEDLTQEAFLQAFRKIDTFRGESAFSSWLYRIATNVVLMHRRKKVHLEVPLEDPAAPNGIAAGVGRFISHLDPAQRLAEQMSMRWALDQLPNGFRKVLIMHDIEGYRHNEIAKMIGRTVGNSKSQLHNARQRLRKLLASESHAPQV